MKNNQVSLPQGIVKVGAAATSLGEFMAQNGASPEDIQKAQTELIEMVGTEVPQPATDFLKSWAVLMGGAPALSAGAPAAAASIAAGGVIGGTSNALVQLTLNGEQEMSRTDVLIAIATGAATQGRGIVATVSTSASGAALGAIIKGNNIEESVIGAVIGAGAGARAGVAIGGLAKSVATPAVSDAFGAVAGSLISEGTTTAIQKKMDAAREKNEEN